MQNQSKHNITFDTQLKTALAETDRAGNQAAAKTPVSEDKNRKTQAYLLSKT